MIEHHHHIDADIASFALALLRGESPPGVREADAARFAEGLRRSGLSALALRRRNGASALPAPLRELLERERSISRASLAVLYDRLGRLAGTLDGAGVPFILLKGAALAPLLYGAVEERPMVDVDLLIRRSDWPAARDALGREGYHLPAEAEQRYWLANYFNMAIGAPGPRGAAGASFDVHWGIAQPVRYHVDDEGLWARAVPFEAEGRRCLRLGNEDLLLNLLLHLAYHYFDARLLWLYDLHLLCRKVPIDWEEARRRAGAWGMGTVHGLALAYVEKAFPGSIPPAALEASAPGPVRRALLAPLRSGAADRLFRWDDARLAQLVQGLLVMDDPAAMIAFTADKIARRLRFLGSRPRLR